MCQAVAETVALAGVPSLIPSTGTLTDDAYRVIRWGIVTLQLQPGASFTESELAEKLTLSRTPLREALLLLRTEGLVTVEGRAGYKVSPITLRDVHDVASIQRVLEGEAAFLAAAAVTSGDQLIALSERVPHEFAAAAPSTVLNWIESDMRFHIALAAATGNQLLVDALLPVLGKYSRILHLVLMLGTAPASVTHSHVDLMAALGKCDGNWARQAVVAQIGQTEEVISRALIRSPSLLATNVVVEKPINAFYLDVKSDESAKAGVRKGVRAVAKNRKGLGVAQ